MCLDYDLTTKQADKIKAEARKRGYIRVYKVCNKGRTGWHIGSKWKKGLRRAMNIRKKDGGWYAYLNITSAWRVRNYWGKKHHFIKVCYAKSEWIKRIGKSHLKKYNSVGIFTHLCFPDWEKGDMTIREFRAMSKGKP